MEYGKFLEGLEENERIYVESRLRGMSKMAAMRAAGLTGGAGNGGDMDHRPQVIEAFRKAHAASARETGITRDKVGEMLLEAYRNATNAAEQIMAARELGRLYGHYAPEKVEVAHKLEQIASDQDLRNLSHEDLVRLAKMEQGITIDGEFEVLPRPALVSIG